MEQLILAERLTELRKAANVSQAKVAETLSVSRQAVSKWESGKASPSLAVCASLASLYGVTLDRVLAGKDFEPQGTPVTPEGQTFAERLRSLRTLRGVSQPHPPHALSVSRQSVSKWERGESEPDSDKLIAMASLLDTPLAILLPAAPTADISPAQDEKAEEVPLAEEEQKTVEAPATEEAGKQEEPPKAEEQPQVETTPTPPMPKRDKQSEARFQKIRERVLAVRKSKKKTSKQERENKHFEFRTIAEIGPNDPAYVYVNKDDGKVRTILPFLAAIPICTTAIALMVKKKYKK